MNEMSQDQMIRFNALREARNIVEPFQGVDELLAVADRLYTFIVGGE